MSAIKTSKKKRKTGRPSKAHDQARRLHFSGFFRLKDSIRNGVPAQSLARLVESGIIVHVERDLYRHRDAKIDPVTEDFAIACARFGPASAIGGLTALFHYQLLDESPSQIWVLVPPERITRMSHYKIIRTKVNLKTGINDHDTYRIATVERAVAEAFKYAHRLGLETALGAARLAIKTKLTTASKILKIARSLDLENCVIKHWEAITAV